MRKNTLELESEVGESNPINMNCHTMYTYNQREEEPLGHEHLPKPTHTRNTAMNLQYLQNFRLGKKMRGGRSRMCGDTERIRSWIRRRGYWGDCGGREIEVERLPMEFLGNLLGNAFLGAKAKIAVSLSWMVL